MIKRCRRLDRQVEHRGHRNGFRPSRRRAVSRKRIEEIEPAELPKAKSAERCSRVAILAASALLQLRGRDREGGKAVVLKGKASRAKQRGCRAQRPCKR